LVRSCAVETSGASRLHFWGRTFSGEERGMPEKEKGFWERIFSGSHRSAREERVLDYVIHRIEDGAHLDEILQEQYVRRNASPEEAREILDNPRLVEAAHESLRREFASGRLDPSRRPSRSPEQIPNV